MPHKSCVHVVNYRIKYVPTTLVKVLKGVRGAGNKRHVFPPIFKSDRGHVLPTLMPMVPARGQCEAYAN